MAFSPSRWILAAVYLTGTHAGWKSGAPTRMVAGSMSTTLTPRQQLMPTPYAIFRQHCESTDGECLVKSWQHCKHRDEQCAGNRHECLLRHWQSEQLRHLFNHQRFWRRRTTSMQSPTEALATTNYLNTATNNFGTAVAVNLINAANQFAGTFAGNGSGLTNVGGVALVDFHDKRLLSFRRGFKQCERDILELG